MTIEELERFHTDYIEKYPKWKKDEGIKTERNPFALASNSYQSGTETASNTTNAWYINFNYGCTHYNTKTYRYRVVCIYD